MRQINVDRIGFRAVRRLVDEVNFAEKLQTSNRPSSPEFKGCCEIEALFLPEEKPTGLVWANTTKSGSKEGQNNPNKRGST